MVGRILLHYRLLERVGQGGMAEVFRAKDTRLDREVAVKVLHRHLQSESESRLRFQREAQAVARLRHPNILEIYEYHVAEGGSGESFLVTEFVGGPTLRAVLLRHPPRYAETAALIASELCAALSAAHKEGVIHRDVKPENVLLRRDGTLVLCDFGIARILDKDTVTATGQLLGSPAYMAPEHIEGRPQDARSDLFSLGVLMYEAVCGELPFRGQNPHETLRKIAAAEYVPLEERAPDCPRHIARIVTRALEREPDRRYPDAEEMRADLLDALREVGITDAHAELTAYVCDPLGWEAAFAPRLVAALSEKGRALRSAGRTAAALQAWARAQHYAPRDRVIAGLIASVSRRNRLRRMTLYAAGGVGALLLTAATVHFARLPGRSGPPDLAAARADARTGPQAAAGRPELGAPPEGALEPGDGDDDAPFGEGTGPGTGSRGPGRPRVRIAKHAPKVSPFPAAVVRLEPWPKAVRVTHNGRSLGDYGSDVRTATLDPGPNEFLFENPACYTERVLLPRGIRPEEVRVRLRWKPALLQVRATAPGKAAAPPVEVSADVMVDGRLVGRSGQVVALPLSSDDGQQEVKVQILAPGHRTRTETVTLHANQLKPLEVELAPIGGPTAGG